ncbi:MAG: hypothetical protein JSV97_04790 [candidate division WOR-3 bacterium]|nr:MAG: hypothetical protein JSV97_04790 [candidate division WOR-3 bacterium]
MVLTKALLFTTYFSENVIKDFMNAPANLLVVCATPVGVPKAWTETQPRKDSHEFIVYAHFEEK